jgi:AraC family transcriptional regulator
MSAMKRPAARRRPVRKIQGGVPHLHFELLFESPIVRVADVVCRAPRSGPGEEELSDVAQIVLPGRGVFEVHRDGERVVADTNTALVLGLGEEYGVSHPVVGGDECTALAFAPELMEEAVGGVGGRDGGLRPATHLGARLLTSALASGASDRLETEEAALLLLDALGVDLATNGARSKRRPGQAQRRRVEEARALLASDPTARWRLDTVARAVHSSPFHLARQFRAVTGESISRYLLRLRLGLALIAAGETEFARLAVELGFAHHSHFSARFRSVFGTTPTQARRELASGRLRELSTIVTAALPAAP